MRYTFKTLSGDVDLVNLTEHEINVIGLGGLEAVIAPSGTVARVSTTDVLVGTFKAEYPLQWVVSSPEEEFPIYEEEFPIYVPKYGEVTGLPSPKKGVIYIVSGMVKDAVPKRADLRSPGRLLRNEKGQPVGCKGVYMSGE